MKCRLFIVGRLGRVSVKMYHLPLTILVHLTKPNWRKWPSSCVYDARLQYILYTLPLFESHVLNPRMKHIICTCRTLIDILQLLCGSFNFKFSVYFLFATVPLSEECFGVCIGFITCQQSRCGCSCQSNGKFEHWHIWRLLYEGMLDLS